MGFLTSDGYIGISRQIAKGSPLAPQKFAQFITGSPNIENEMKQFREGGFGRQGAFVKKVGMKMSPSILVNMRPDIAGLLLTMALGSDVLASATAEITTIDCEADTSGSLNSKYWLLSSITTDYYVWYDVNSVGVDPVITGKTGIKISVATNADATAVATATKTAIALLDDFGADNVAGLVTVTNTDKGAVEDAKDGDTTWTDAWTVTTPGVGGAEFETTTVVCEADVAGSLNNKYWLLSSINADYYLWYNVNSAGADPSVASKIGIEVALATNATADNVATATASALNALGDFVCPAPAAATITIITADKGSVTDATDGNTTWTGAWTVTVQGVDGWLHTITPINSLQWWSIEFGRINMTLLERVEDAKIQSLVISGSAGDLIQMVIEAIGLNVDASAGISTPSPISFETDEVLQFLGGTFTIFGSTSAEVRSFTLTITNNLDPIQTNALTYQQLMEGDLDVVLDMTVKVTTDDEYRKVHYGGSAGSAPSSDVEESQVILFFTNGLLGENNREITITITRLAYLSMPLTELNADSTAYEYAISGIAKKHSTNNLIDVTVLNEQPIEYDALTT